jgi:dihydroneopterin aldolase
LCIESGGAPTVKTAPHAGFRYSSARLPVSSHPMDLIYVRNLKIDCVIGAFEWERRIRQTVAIDLDLAADVARAASTDRLGDTVDYKAIAKRLIDYVGNSEFRLVETMAERIAEIVRREFPVAWVRVRINKKGALRHATDVGVIIERGQKP